MSQPPVSLRLLGGVSLEREGRPINGRATQRRRIGLLTLLAAAPTGQVSRDRLIAFLWPEAETEAARHLLAGAVYELRKALGDDAIVSRGGELALNPAVIECDTVLFENSVAEGAREQAVELYRGTFADGLHVSQAAEFERWLEETRSRYRNSWRKTLASLAGSKSREGDDKGAADCWIRLAESDPADAANTLRAAESLQTAGEPGLALRLCHQHAAHMQRELGADPDQRVTRMARQITEQQRQAPESAADSTSSPTAFGPATSPSRNRVGQAALWIMAGAAALLLVALTRDQGAHAEVLPSDRLTKVATEGTSFRPALQAWLLGEREFRSGHFLAASEHFAQAAEADSNFALAFYRLSQARLAADLPEADAGKADRRLEQLSPTLAERERLLLSAYSGFRLGNAEYAEQRYQGLTTHFADDLEAWLQLGETRFHYGPLRGIPLAAAEPAFRNAAGLDKGNWNANWHLASLAALAGNREDCVQAIERLLAMSPEPTQRLELELLKAIAERNQLQEAAALRQLHDADELVLFQIVWRTAVFFRDLDAAERVARMMVARGRPTYSQMLGRLSLLHLKLAGGDTAAARMELSQADQLTGTESYARNARAGTMLLPQMPGSHKEVASLRDTIQLLLPTLPEAEALHYQLVLGFLNSALGQPQSTLELANQIEARGSRDWALVLRAEAAYREGRYEDVIAHLRNRGLSGWYGNIVSSLNGFEGRARFLRAEALFHTGRLEEALGWYGSLGEHALADLGYWPVAQQRRKEILSRLSK